MAKRRIFTVGFTLPGDEFEYVEFDSDQTLLDADIILFQPTLGDHYGLDTYNGRQLLNEHSSFAAKRQLDHWRSEIAAAVNAGKIVVGHLEKLLSIPIACGPSVNVNESKRERSGIICRQFCGVG